MEIIVETLIVFGAFKIGQHMAVVPAGTAVFAGPKIIIGCIPARINLRIDAGAAADDFCLRIAQHPIFEVFLRNGFPAPARHTLGHLGKPGWHVKQRIPVATTSFQQQHFYRSIFAQTIGENAAGRPTTHDDIIVIHRLTLIILQSTGRHRH